MKIMTNAKTIMAAIETIGASGKALDKMIQEAGVAVLAHNEKHGDPSLANALIAAMPKGSRVSALKGWMLVHGKLSFNPEKKVMVYKKGGETNIDAAIAEPWTDFKPEPPFQALDLSKAVAKLVTKAEDRAETPDARDSIDLARLTELAAMVAAWDLADSKA